MQKRLAWLAILPLALGLAACATPAAEPTAEPTALAMPTEAPTLEPTVAPAAGTPYTDPAGWTMTLPASWEGKVLPTVVPSEEALPMYPKAKSVTQFLYQPSDPANKPEPILTVSVYSSADWAAMTAEGGPPVGTQVSTLGDDVIVATTPQSSPYAQGTADQQAFDTLFQDLDLALAFATPAEAAGGATGDAARLVGPTWQWQETRMNDGSTTTPADPASYTIQFKEDGSLQAQVDCNTAAGTYTVTGTELSITLGAMTMMACPEGSLADTYAQQLGDTYAWLMDGEILVLDLKMDSGGMRFAAAP